MGISITRGAVSYIPKAVFRTFHLYENEKTDEKLIDGEFHGSGHFMEVGRYSNFSFYLDENKATVGKTANIRFGIYDGAFQLLREGVFPIDHTTLEDKLYFIPFQELVIEEPQIYYVSFGRNDTLGGNFDIKCPRIDSNGNLNIDALFKFSNATGNLPLDVEPMRVSTNRIFYSIITG
jgi:hypothetical protein